MSMTSNHMDIKLTQDKAGRLGPQKLMTHAMVLTGVDLDENGKSTKWKVENFGETRSVQMVTLLPQMLGWTNTPIKSLFAKNC